METVNDVPVLLRREIEALAVVPLLKAFAQELGWERTREIATGVITAAAEQAGRGLAHAAGGTSLEALKHAMPAFGRGGALHVEVRESGDACLRMDITQCKYCQMYQRLGMEEFGTLLSCERDRALFCGFNPKLAFTRSGTIMEGAACCDFCLREEPAGHAD